MRKAWYSIFDFSFDYKGEETPFTDAGVFKWSRPFEELYPEVKKELEHYLKEHHLQSYFSKSMVNGKDTWKTVSLKTWGIELRKVQREFPQTSALLKQYPEIVSASFSLLEAGSRIKPHCGDTNAVYRCHLGIDIPAGLPECGFKVKDELREWKNGKWFAFMDAYVHEAWNETNKGRYVFIADVMRPEFMDQQKKVCSTVRTSLFLQKRFTDLATRPVFAKLMTFMLRPFIRCGIFMVNLLKVY